MLRSLLAASSALAVILGGGQATAVPLDAQVLIQTASKPHTPLCTSQELADYNAATKLHLEDVRAVKKRREDAELAKFNRTIGEISKTLSALSVPLIHSGQQIASVALDAVKPAVKDVLKFLMWRVATPEAEYTAPPVLTKERLKEDGEEAIAKLGAAEERVYLDAFRSLDSALDEHVRESHPRMVGKFRALPAYPTTSNDTEAFIKAFVSEKLGPIMSVDAFPELETLVSLLLQAPRSAAEIPAFISGSVIPALPEPCQSTPGAVMQVVSPGAGLDLAGLVRLSGVVSGCAALIVPKTEAREELPKAPTRACATCDEHQSEVDDQCVPLCLPMAAQFLAGINDKLLRASVPCLKCQRSARAQNDACKSKDDHAWEIRKMDAITEAVENGSLEEVGADSFAEQLFNAIFKA